MALYDRYPSYDPYYHDAVEPEAVDVTDAFHAVVKFEGGDGFDEWLSVEEIKVIFDDPTRYSDSPVAKVTLYYLEKCGGYTFETGEIAYEHTF